uniref:Ig-like domain-containing protein n=1 Tax=Salmo trutta TaxID=8032 RepID=A0A674F591_SALTR
MFFFFTGTSVEDMKSPDRDVVDVMEGSSVQLSCRYNSSLTNSLLWYLQHPGSSPQFLIVDYSGIITNTDKHIPDKRYTSTTSWTLTELVITRLTLADTALYYCALRDDTQRYNVYKTLYKNLQIKMLC